MEEEQVVDVVTAYQTGTPDSVVVVIPKHVRNLFDIQKGQRFVVKVDRKHHRIIYEPLAST